MPHKDGYLARPSPPSRFNRIILYPISATLAPISLSTLVSRSVSSRRTSCARLDTAAPQHVAVSARSGRAALERHQVPCSNANFTTCAVHSTEDLTYLTRAVKPPRAAPASPPRPFFCHIYLHLPLRCAPATASLRPPDFACHRACTADAVRLRCCPPVRQLATLRAPPLPSPTRRREACTIPHNTPGQYPRRHHRLLTTIYTSFAIDGASNRSFCAQPSLRAAGVTPSRGPAACLTPCPP